MYVENVMKYSVVIQKMEKYIDDVADVSDLPYDEICIILGINK